MRLEIRGKPSLLSKLMRVCGRQPRRAGSGDGGLPGSATCLRIALTALLSLAWCAAASAQARYPWEDYAKRVKSSQSVSPLGPDLFGDQVSLSNGALSFSVTDVSLPGNSGLPVAFTRTYSVFNRKDYGSDEMLADWAVDLPSISGTFAPNWISRSSPSNRCSDTQAPPMPSSAHFLTEFWHGLQINLPGRGSSELLVTNPGAPDPGDGDDGGGVGTNPPPGSPGPGIPVYPFAVTDTSATAPTVPVPTDGPTYRWATNDHVQVSCLPSIKNGAGQGFLAITPDGTRYWFDWMAQYYVPPLESPFAVIGIHQTKFTDRRKNVLYATRVEDRFGNSVTYSYDNEWHEPGKLTAITASDGRTITIGYGSNGHVASVSDGAHTWQYDYADTSSGRDTLTTVIRPDTNQWTIDFAGFTNAEIRNHEVFTPGEIYRTCTMLETPLNYDAQPVGSITHPSGAVGTFTVSIGEHGRSNVPVSCGNVTQGVPPWGNDPNDDINTFVISYNSFTLDQKTLSGPGVPAATWSYSYVSGISRHFYPGTTRNYPVCTVGAQCYQPPCTSDSCAGASFTTVVGPDNTWARYTYGNSFKYNEGKLLEVERGSSAADILRTTVNTYDLSRVDQAYPASFGDSIQPNDQGFTAQFHRPLTRSVITQQGETFTRKVDVFDVLARPLTVTRFSSLGDSRTDVVTYYDDPDLWVMGQVATSTNVETGLVEAQTEYDPASALPIWSKRFGKLQHTLAYYADGSLKSVTDERGLTTTLSSWYRGVPRSIQYADGSSESAVVTATGTIASATDENGFTTSYTYDAMGRLTSITHPTGGAMGWNTTTQAFTQVGASEYGIGAGHWRQTVSTGDARTVTYFDALWRPLLTREYDAADVAGTQRFTRRLFDHAGRAVFVSYPGDTADLSTGTWTAYDALGRPKSVSQDSEYGLLTTTTRYKTGFVTEVTNPRGYATTTGYMAYDQPTTDWPRAIEHPGEVVTDIVRDVFGKPKSLTRHGGP